MRVELHAIQSLFILCDQHGVELHVLTKVLEYFSIERPVLASPLVDAAINRTKNKTSDNEQGDAGRNHADGSKVCACNHMETYNLMIDFS